MEKKAEQLSALVGADRRFLESPLSGQKTALARRLGLDREALEALVRRTWGLDFYRWMYRRRIDRACRLLGREEHAETNISAIAFDCGYPDIGTFNSHFKSQTGMTPTEYRAFRIHFRRITGVSPEKFKRGED